MSHLSRPRAHFYGTLGVNMPTGNNAAYDSRDRLYFDAAHATLDLLGGSPKQFREWLHQINPSGYVNGGWNYYGDNSLRFDSVAITSVELPDRPILTRSQEDACIGAQVFLRGSPYRGGRTGAILVDVDPNDGFTTQLFADQLTLEQAQTPLLTATAPIKTYSRNFNFWRNLEIGGDRGASAVWYFAFPAEALAFGENLGGSPFLDWVKQGPGICVRLCTYLFQHRLYRDIAESYRAGERYPQPAAMLVIGTIGLWHPDQPATQPAARFLPPDLANPLPMPLEVKSLRRGKTFYAGAAWAAVDTARRIVTLDLVNTFPEVDRFETLEAGPQAAPAKVNLGTLALEVQPTDGTPPQQIGTLPVGTYDRAAYLLAGGLVEIPYPEALESALLAGDLALRAVDAPSLLILRENPYHVIIEPRSAYLELESAESVSFSVRVLVRGTPAPAGLELGVTQTANPHSQPREATSDTDAGSGADGSPDAAGDVVMASSSLITDSDGRALLRVQARRAGMAKLWVHTPTDPPWELAPEPLLPILRSSLGYFANVRALPDDRAYDALSDAELTWDALYTAVLRYYSLLYPIMNLYINFEDEVLTRAAAARIVAYIQPGLKDTTIYMPITRDLSAGKRRLLERWAAKVQRS